MAINALGRWMRGAIAGKESVCEVSRSEVRRELVRFTTTFTVFRSQVSR